MYAWSDKLTQNQVISASDHSKYPTDCQAARGIGASKQKTSLKRAGCGISGTSGIKWTKCSEATSGASRCSMSRSLESSLPSCLEVCCAARIRSPKSHVKSWIHQKVLGMRSVAVDPGSSIFWKEFSHTLPFMRVHILFIARILCQASLSKNSNNMHHVKYRNTHQQGIEPQAGENDATSCGLSSRYFRILSNLSFQRGGVRFRTVPLPSHVLAQCDDVLARVTATLTGQAELPGNTL